MRLNLAPRLTLAAGLAVLLAVLLASPVRAAAPPDAVAAQRSYPLPGDGPWDYVSYDPEHHRVFLGRYSGVQVIDSESGRLQTSIGARTGDHGATVAADQHRLFTSDAAAGRLGVYDLTSLAPQPPVRLGGEPDGLLYEPASHRLLAFLPRSHAIVAVDVRTLHFVGRLDVGGEPEAGVADGHGGVFVTLRDRGEVIRVDAAALQVRARWPAGCARPRPVALDAAKRRLFVACADRHLVRLDATTGRVDGVAEIGDGADGMAFDATGRRVLVSSGSGALSLVEADAAGPTLPAVVIPMPLGARTMAFDAAARRVFTVTADIARVQPPTASRPYPRLIPKAGTFRLIVVQLPP